MRSALVLLTAVLGACSASNNVLLGHVEGDVGGHHAVVTDCYRINLPSPDAARRSEDGRTLYRWAPCRDAVIVLLGSELSVNGQAYGRLAAGDTIVVDHGSVSVARLLP